MNHNGKAKRDIQKTELCAVCRERQDDPPSPSETPKSITKEV
jgi:hypothetical protein